MGEWERKITVGTMALLRLGVGQRDPTSQEFESARVERGAKRDIGNKMICIA